MPAGALAERSEQDRQRARDDEHEQRDDRSEQERGDDQREEGRTRREQVAGLEFSAWVAWPTWLVSSSCR